MDIVRGLLKLIFITVLTLMGLSGGVFVLRQTALHRPTVNPDAAFAQVSLFSRGDETSGPRFSRAGFLALFKKVPDAIPTLDVRPTADHKWVVYGSERLEDLTNGHGLVESKTHEELSALRLKNGDAILGLSEFLEEFKPARIAIIVHSREAAGVTSLLEELKSRSEESPTFIIGQAQAVLRELRKRRPLWFYSNDTATLAKFRLMAAIYLEPVADFAADFFLVKTKPERAEPLTERMVAELKRRHKPLFLEVNELSTVPNWLKNSVNGVLTDRPALLAKEFIH